MTLLANSNTGLNASHTFAFGSAIAEMNLGNVGTPLTLRVNATDTSRVRQNQSISSDSVPVTSIFDLNKDGRVNATDTSIVRQNQRADVLRYFTASGAFVPPSINSQFASIPAIESSTLESNASLTTSPDEVSYAKLSTPTVELNYAASKSLGSSPPSLFPSKSNLIKVSNTKNTHGTSPVDSIVCEATDQFFASYAMKI